MIISDDEFLSAYTDPLDADIPADHDDVETFVVTDEQDTQLDSQSKWVN